MITTSLNLQCLAMFLVIWVCPIVLAKPSSYVKIQAETQDDKAFMAAQDSVIKHLEAAPDSHSNTNDEYRKQVTVKETLVTPSGGKLNTNTDVRRANTNKVEEHLTHTEDGGAEKTTDRDTDRYLHLIQHKDLDEKTRKAVLHVDNSSSDHETEKRHVIKTSDGALIIGKGERAVTAVMSSHMGVHSNDGGKVTATEKLKGHVDHSDRKTTSTVFVHDSDPNNYLIAGDKDTDIDSYSDDFVGTHQQSQQNTPKGQLSKSSNVFEETKLDRIAHEHETGAYHETPIHKFVVNDKEAEVDARGRYTKTEDKSIKFKGKDGFMDYFHENKKRTFNEDRAEHTDDLVVKTILKDHPESPLTVTLSSKIIDRDHYTLKESTSQNKQTKLQNGGTRNIQVNEEREKTYNYDTTPGQTTS